ncbi:MAG: hypothetical protein WKF73_02505 [Nocardioidaceae bacterium]
MKLKAISSVRPAVGVEAELEAVVEEAGEGGGGRRGRGDARGHHREGDQEREEVHPERLVRVERSTGGLGVLRDQLEIGQGCDRGDDEGSEERRPGGSAHFAGNVTGQCVDTGAEDVTHNEEQQELWPHDPLELGLTVAVSVDI